MPNAKSQPPAKERWGERVIAIILFLSGLVLFLASTFFTGLLQEALGSIGLGFLGTAFATGIILALVGSDVGGLRSEIKNLNLEVQNLHSFIDQDISIIFSTIGKLSKLINNASSLGIVELGRSRRSSNFEGNKDLVGRWKDLLEHAMEVDVICFADSLLFSSDDVFNPSFIKKVRERMKQKGEKRLILKIILTSLDNPYNKEIDHWSEMPHYMESRVTEARTILRRLCGETLNPEVISNPVGH